MYSFNIRTLWVLLLSAVLSPFMNAQAFVFPREFKFTESASSTSVWFSGYYHAQYILTFNAFSSQTLGYGLEYGFNIDSMAFRINGGNTSGSAVTIPNLKVWMSSTTASTSNPSNTFSANRGTDFTLVYQGDVSIVPGLAQSPNIYQPTIVFQTPFSYNPVSGPPLQKLLIEIEYTAPSLPVYPACDALSVVGGTAQFSYGGIETLSSGSSTGTDLTHLPVMALGVQEPANLARRMRLGTGCGPTGGTTISLVTLQRPVMNTVISLDTEFIPTNALATAVFLSIPGFEQGMSLDPLMPGCTLFVQNLDVSLMAPPPILGGAIVDFMIQNDPSWLGLEVFGQSASLVDGANQIGAYASNGVWLRFGNL